MDDDYHNMLKCKKINKNSEFNTGFSQMLLDLVC